MSQLSRARLLVIDELGFLPLDADGARPGVPGVRRRLRAAERGHHHQPRVQPLGLGVRRRPDGGRRHRPRRPPRAAGPVPGESYRVRHALMQEGQALKKPVHASCAGCSISDAHSAQKSLTKHMLRRSVLGGDRGARRGRRPELVPRRVRRRALERGGPRLRCSGSGRGYPSAPPSPARSGRWRETRSAASARSARELKQRGPSTKAQVALAERREALAQESAARDKERREEERRRRFEQRQEKAKRKRRVVTLAGQSGGRGAQDSAVIPRAPYGFRLHPRRPVAAREEGSRHGPLAHRRPPTSRPESPPIRVAAARADSLNCANGLLELAVID